MKKKLLLIGAGPTSSLIAYSIKKCPKLNGVFDIFVWEKSRGTGGRFSTSRSPTNSNCYADLGAQYLTCCGQPFSKPYFENLLDQQLIRPFDTSKIPGFRQDSTKTNYVCTSGTASIVKHFFDKGSESNICFNKRVDGIFPNKDHKIEVSNEEGQKELFDVVISTMPIPQVLQLKNIDNVLNGKDELKKKLESVKYTSRYAMGFFYDDKDVSFKSTHQPINFVSNDPIIKYWSIENLKRAGGSEASDEPCAVVVHSSTEYGAEHVEETPDSLKSFLTEKVQNMLDIGVEPAFVKSHKWRYSQVDKPFPEQPGFVEISKNFVAAGDGLSYSGFEGCIKSADKTVAYLETVI